MAFTFGYIVFAFYIFQVVAEKQLNVTVFYETLCPYSMKFFKEQLWPAYQNHEIASQINVELVPFGKADYTEDPWQIKCQHGERECWGNVLEACFINKHHDNSKQVAFVSCCMSCSKPPEASKECASKVGEDYEEIEKCSKSEEGKALQIKNGLRTKNFRPPIKSYPSIVYNEVFDKDLQEESTTNFKRVVLRKLRKLHQYESNFKI